LVEQVKDPYQISLNAYKYPIRGQLTETPGARFPPKTVIGDYDYANEQLLSNWILADQRGGMLVEEMDESAHLDRCWWTTVDLRYPRSWTLPPLATKMEIPDWASPTGHTDPDAKWSNPERAYDADDSTAAASIGNIPAVSWGSYLQLSFTSLSLMSVAFLVDDTTDSNITEIDIDYYDGSWHDIYEGTFTEEVRTTKVLPAIVASVTEVRVRFYNAHAADAKSAYLADVHVSKPDSKGIAACKEFNSETYFGIGSCVSKIDSGGTYLQFLQELDATITDMDIAFGALQIAIGDADEYYSMSTAEAFTASTDVNNKDQWTHMIYWDGKLFGCDSAGAMDYCTASGGATTEADTNGALPVDDNDLQGLDTYRDADGTDIIYARTKKGIFAYDFATTKWWRTELSLPNHPNGGKGGCVWRDAYYISSGSHIDSYQTGQSRATIASVGLDEDDGLPTEYSGEIVDLIAGDKEIYALVDASLATGTSTSGVYTRTGRGWQCIWTGSSEGAMNHGIVTTSPSYRFYWDENKELYYIPLYRGNQKPKKIATYTYGAAGVWISGWFNAGTDAFAKLVTLLTSFTKSITNTETIALKYRTDRTYTNIATDWTTLDTLNTTGEAGQNEETFGTLGIGVAPYAIQLRLDFARGSTTTLSPELQGLVLSYMRLLGTTWAWTAQVVISKDGYDGQKAKAMWENIRTAIETETLVEFTFRNESDGTETHYCKVTSPSFGRLQTGEDYSGVYNIAIVEP